MRIGIPSLGRFDRGDVIDRDLLPENLGSLGIDLSSIPSVMPVSIQKMPQAEPGTPTWWQAAGYTSANDAIMSGNFNYDMNKGWQLKPGAVTPAMEEIAAKSTPPTKDTSSFKPLSNVVSTDLGPLGTSGMSVFEDEPITMASDSTSPMSPMVETEVTLPSSDSVGMKAQEYQDFLDKLGSTKVDEELKNLFPTDQTDPVQAAVDAAVGNGQPTTDDTILDPDDMVVGAQIVTQYYNPATGETFTQYNTAQPVPEGFIPGSPPETPAQPDFMTQLQELIASMQAEQTAAAEQAAAAEAERQKQAAEMTQNYMVGQPAVGYNPYESGQYQNNPYGAAGVPAMGGITTIPVPAAYNPNPYPIGGTT
tara:strand:- start:155 stop:1246 length:1092 start_codon:yes stop_codon:yes gene_type:complete